MANFIGAVIGLVLAVVMVTSVLIPTVKAVNTSGWSTSEVAIIGLASIVSLAGLAYSVAAAFGLA